MSEKPDFLSDPPELKESEMGVAESLENPDTLKNMLARSFQPSGLPDCDDHACLNFTARS
jgi:hypothetical protein